MASKSLSEKIEQLPPERLAEVEAFVDSRGGRTPRRRLSREELSQLMRRIDERRERLRREVGLFDSVAAISELRDE